MATFINASDLPPDFDFNGMDIPEKLVIPEKISALSAFGKAAITTPVQALQNLISKSGVPSVSFVKDKQGIPRLKLSPMENLSAEQVLPKSLLATEQSRQQHPIASFAGDVTGFLPLGGATIRAARALIPGLEALTSRFAPSFLGRAGTGALEGGGLGALYSPKGKMTQGALEGALLGSSLNAILPPVLKTSGVQFSRPGASRAYENLVNESELTNEQLNQLKSQLKSQYGKSEPESFLRSATDKAKKIQDLSQISGEPLKQTTNLFPTPQETTLKTLVPEAEENLNLTHDYISNYLGKGETHDVNAARAITENVNNIKNTGRNLYTQLDDSLSSKNVVIPKTADLLQLDKDLEKLISKSSGLSPEQIENFRNAIIKSQSQGSDIIPATDYLQNYRITRDTASEYRQKGYKEQASVAEKEMQPYYREQAKKFQELADKMIGLLKEQIGAQDSKLLTDATNYWRDNVIPLQKNKIVWQSDPDNFGRINSTNIIHELRGDNPGNKLLRNMAKTDPRIAKNLLGQRFADNPSKIVDANKETQQYINALPELKTLISGMQKATKKLSKAEIESKYLKEDIDRIEKRLIEDAKTQKQALDARKKIEQLKKEIKDDIKNAEDLKSLLERKDLQSKQRKEAKDKLNKINLHIKKRNQKILKLGKLALYFGAGVHILKLLGGLLR